MQKKILELIDEYGLIKALQITGLRYADLRRIMGDTEFISEEKKFDAIATVVSNTDYGYITMQDLNLNPIVLKDTKKELVQIEMLYDDYLVAFEYRNPRIEGDFFEYEDEGELTIYYSQLKPKDIQKIFLAIMGYYDKNIA